MNKPYIDASYFPKWHESFGALSAEDIRGIKQHIENFKFLPEIVVLLRLDKASSTVTTEHSIASVKAQLYPNWKLWVLAEDISSDLSSFLGNVSGIRIFTTRSALIEAYVSAGDFSLTFIETGDGFAPHAFYLYAFGLNSLPDTKLTYGDTELLEGINPAFNPDWNKQLLYSSDYISHGAFFRKEVVNLDEALTQGNGAAYFTALSASLHVSPKQCLHIPFLIYKHHHHADMTAVRESFFKKISGTKITYKNAIPHIQWPINELPPVTIIIPTKDNHQMLSRCLDSLFRGTDYQGLSIIIVSNQSSDPEMLKTLELYDGYTGIRVIRHDQPFNFSALCNLGVKESNDEIVVFLNDDVEAANPYWLKEMVSYAVQPEIGAVGARLLFPDGRLQHAGVMLGANGIASHYFYKKPDQPGYMSRAHLAADIMAVTGACLMVRKKLFEEVGGFDEQNLAINFNDVDFCLKLISKGYRNIYTPFAKLMHHESASRGKKLTDEQRVNLNNEIQFILKKWPEEFANDQFYNPNLDREKADFSLSFSPRINKPWQQYMTSSIPSLITRHDPIIVMGMHRSGTSLVAELLERMGVFMGAEKDENHEALFFLKANEQLFQINGSHWDEPSEVSKNLHTPRKLKELHLPLYKHVQSKHLAKYLGPEFYRKYRQLERMEKPWGWKDPRNSISMPLWKAIFPKAKIINVLRHGVDVAESLRQRSLKGNIKRTKRCINLSGGFTLWQEYTKDATHWAQQWPQDSLTLKYEELLLHSAETISAIAGFCKISLTADQMKEIQMLFRKEKAYKYKNDAGLLEFSKDNAAILSDFGY